jgi:polyhydroxyalkanoate synthase
MVRLAGIDANHGANYRSGMTNQTPEEPAEHAASVLAPEINLLADPDVAGLGRSLAMVLRGAMEHPADAAQAWFRYAARLAEIPPVALSTWMGIPATPPVPLNPKDRRFADRTWSENPAFYSLRMYHQAFAEFVDQLVTAARLERIQETKARLLTGLMMDTLAPTNFLLTNPAALKYAVETGGVSVVKGARNFADDLLNNNARPRQVDTSKFTIGKNLAATPAKVVYRNDLMELLQYSAQTPQVHSAPLL